MSFTAITDHHEAAATREDEAAIRASSPEIARLHNALADMHRHEAAKKESVRRMLERAFRG